MAAARRQQVEPAAICRRRRRRTCFSDRYRQIIIAPPKLNWAILRENADRERSLNQEQVVGACEDRRELEMEEDMTLVRCGGEVLENINEDEESILRNRVACHPMFGLLKETHLNCLKACLGDKEDDRGVKREVGLVRNSSNHGDGDGDGKMDMNLSELDLFMEAHYMSLLELKKTIEESVQEASAFVELMHCLLPELTAHDDHQTPAAPAPIITSSTSLLEKEDLELMRRC